MIQSPSPSCLECSPRRLVQQLCMKQRRILLTGQPGVGKTTLAAALAGELAHTGQRVWGLSADPGSPGFGVPGAVSLGEWQDNGWCLLCAGALCSLDAARFRLPLISLVRRLVAGMGAGPLLLDAPGVFRAVAGAELLDALVWAAAVDLVLVLLREGQSLPLANELSTLGVEVAYVRAVEGARRPGRMSRARRRSGLWDQHLAGGAEHRIALEGLHLLGTPPRNAPEAWLGKQVAFLQGEETQAMGEVSGLADGMLQLRLPAAARPTQVLLVRDACRGEDGLLATGKGFAEREIRYIPPSDLLPDARLEDQGGCGVRPVVQVGGVRAGLMNGVFGDPLLHLRLSQSRRSLMFDLGEGSRLPARIAHQLTDVFITHAHVDHIAGFLWLLRSRIGETSVCRLYGPPGLSVHINGLMDGVHWDRIGDRGPRFEVMELYGERLERFRLQAGQAGRVPLGGESVERGVLLDEPGFLVRAVTLDHGIPVLAYAFELPEQVNVSTEEIQRRRLKPGPWLTELKCCILAAEHNARIRLPDGSYARAGDLAGELTLITPGSRLVYATDFGDTPHNRQRLASLARGAHTLFCESTFLQQDAEQAARTGHLTTRACAEIASQAGVQHLIPFHFSRRYEERPWQLYEEIAAHCPQVVMPKLGGNMSYP